ncbi:MAG: hypothetical protein AB7V12_13930 [Candidatus Dadabacteria bacterium]
MRHFAITALVLGLMLSGIFGVSALAQSAGDPVPSLSDLVGAKAGQAEGQVTDRGYTLVKTDKSGMSSYSYWTEKGTNNCVTIRTEDGRYQSIVYATKLDCSGSASDTSIAKPSGTSVSALSDLVGAKAGQAEAQVTDRGYTWVKTDKQAGSSLGYWTENSSGKCVKIMTSDGRYQSIDYTSKFSCKAQATTKEAAMEPSGAQSHCKLFNTKSNNYKFDGMCKVNHNTPDDVYDVTLDNGEHYHFTGQGGKYKVQTPEGTSDHKATKIESGGNTAFDWYKWLLMISQH